VSSFCRHKVSLLGVSTKLAVALKGFIVKNRQDRTAHIHSPSTCWDNQYFEDDDQPLHLKTELLTPSPDSEAHIWKKPCLLLWTSHSSTKS